MTDHHGEAGSIPGSSTSRSTTGPRAINSAGQPGTKDPIMSTAHSIEILTDDILADAARCMGAPKLATVIRAFASASDANATSILPECFAALSAANSGGATKPAPAKVKPATASVKAAAPVTSKAPRGARKAAAKVASDDGASKEPKAAKGAKRPRASADFVAQLMDGCEAYVLANPWCATGKIADHLGQKAPKITPLLNRLIDAGKIRKVGEKNATRYGGPESADDSEDGDQAEAAE